MRYRLLDYPVTVTARDPEASAALRAMLRGFPEHDDFDCPAGYALSREQRGGWNVDVRGFRTVQGGTLADAVIALEWQLISDLLSRPSGLFQLHGAALSTPSGLSSLLILGASGAGKTTLTLALMARGFAPLTDDLIFIGPDSLAPEPFQRAFHIDLSTLALIEGLPEGPSWQSDGLPPGYGLPTHWGKGRSPVGAIFFPTVHPNEAPAVTALSIAEATATLLPFSATLDQSPELALAVAARLTGRATCYVLRSGDLAATTDLVARVATRNERGAM